MKRKKENEKKTVLNENVRVGANKILVIKVERKPFSFGTHMTHYTHA